MGKLIKWNGKEAWYDDFEQGEMRAFARAIQGAPEGSRERATLVAELNLLHDMKAVLDARILTEAEAAYGGEVSERPAEEAEFDIDPALAETSLAIPAAVRERLRTGAL